MKETIVDLQARADELRAEIARVDSLIEQREKDLIEGAIESGVSQGRLEQHGQTISLPKDDRLTFRIPANVKFYTAAEQWLDLRRSRTAHVSYVSPRTMKCFEEYVRPLNRYFRDIVMTDIHLGHLREYQQLRASGELGPSPDQIKKYGWKSGEKRTVNANKVNQELAILISIMKRAGVWTIEMQDCYETLQRKESDIGRALTAAEETKLLEVASSRREWDLVRWYIILALRTTAHSREMRTLRIGDINLPQGVIQIRAENAKNRHRIRTIPLTRDAIYAIEWLLERARERGSTLPQHYLFPFRIDRRELHSYDPNRPMTDSGIKKPWDAVRKAAGLPWLRIHDLRHTAITRLAEAGTPIPVIMSMAGHISPRMSSHYTHVSDHAKRRAIEAAFTMRPN